MLHIYTPLPIRMHPEMPARKYIRENLVRALERVTLGRLFIGQFGRALLEQREKT